MFPRAAPTAATAAAVVMSCSSATTRSVTCRASAGARTSRPAVAATAGLEVRAPAEALQVTERVVADEHDITTAAAVAAVGAALGNMRLAAEAQTAVAAAPGLHVDARAVVHAMILP